MSSEEKITDLKNQIKDLNKMLNDFKSPKKGDFVVYEKVSNNKGNVIKWYKYSQEDEANEFANSNGFCLSKINDFMYLNDGQFTFTFMD